MKKYFALSTLVVALGLSLVITPAGTTQAQGPLPLEATYTTNNGLTMYYPEGWSVTEFTEGDAAVIEFDSSADVSMKGFGAELASGEVQIVFVISPASTLYAEFGMTDNATMLDLVNTVGSDPMYDMGAVEAIALGNQQAAWAEGFTADPWNDCLLVAVPLDAQQLVMVQANFSLGEIDLFSATVFSMAELLLAGSSGQPVDQQASEVRQWASYAVASSQYSDTSWNAMQATGAPNTLDCGDYNTAWATSDYDGQDWLQVDYAQAVFPTQINIYQTYNPGSIVLVSVITSDGNEIELANSADPPGNTVCPGVFTVNITESLPAITRVVIYLDQTIGGDWNEIDAVELVGLTAPSAGEPEPVTEPEPVPAPTEPLPEPVTCGISIDQTVNMRIRPGTDYGGAGQLSAGDFANANGQVAGGDGYTWWRLTTGAWVRGDVVNPSPDCTTLPVVDPEEPLPLTEHYVTFDGKQFDYPFEWAALEQDNETIIGNTWDAASRPFGDPFYPGEFQISFQWGTVEDMAPNAGLRPDATPLQVAQAAVADATGINMREPYELLIDDEVTAAGYGTFADMDIEIGLIIFDAGDGMLGTVITVSDLNGLEQFEPTVRAIVASALRYRGTGEAPAAEPAGEEPQAEAPTEAPVVEGPAPAAGDVPALTQTLPFEAINLTVSLPDGWTASDGGGYLIIKNDPFAAGVVGMNPGQVYITVEAGISTAPSAQERLVEFMTMMADGLGLTLTDPVDLVVGSANASRLETSKEGWHLLAVAMERSDGQYWDIHAYTAPDELPLQEPVILAILGSITFVP